jgi:hypothetical protein
MKLSKSTSILINVALVLLIAILAKSLIAFPPSAGAATKKEYRSQPVSEDCWKNGEFVGTLSSLVSQGWSLYSTFYSTMMRTIFLILER